ncbi:hypothetical protein B0H13DRAFT_2345092 [Mycena leptocephala]|nr:hypothetical protein B0H13DRAFT_2345092 [Mycena leptocephala]
MMRQTRSGARFSAWELLDFDLPATSRPAEQALVDADTHANHLDEGIADNEDDEWEDDELARRLPFALEPHPCLRVHLLHAQPPPDPAPHVVAINTRPPIQTPHPRSSAIGAINAPLTAVPSGGRGHARPRPHMIAGRILAILRPIAKSATSSPSISQTHRRLRTFEELRRDGARLLEWNGRDPKLIIDSQGRIIAILLGTPDSAYECVLYRFTQ